MENNVTGLSLAFENDGTLPDWVWHKWLWGSDPEENFHVDVMFNMNQLLGLLICRYKQNQLEEGPVLEYGHRLCLMDKPVSVMNLRELKDTISNLQVEWPTFLSRLKENTRAKANLAAIKALLEQCAGRFGYMAENPLPESILNDPGETKPDKNTGLSCLTTACMRRMLGSLLVLYRHMFLWAHSVDTPPSAYDCGVTKYHQEASMDQFHILYMHFQLPVAAKLNYKHDFPGMYNSVSQPVYYHNSQYQRVKRQDVSQVPPLDPIHSLPSLARLYPDIKIRFEEDFIDPTKPDGWYWLIVAGRIYMVTPKPSILYSDDLSSLVRLYKDAHPASC